MSILLRVSTNHHELVWRLTFLQLFGPDVIPEAQDLISQLCTKDPSKRLCCCPGKGVEQLRNHPFFRDFNWTNLFCRQMPSPFRSLISSAVELDDRCGTAVAVFLEVLKCDACSSQNQRFICGRHFDGAAAGGAPGHAPCHPSYFHFRPTSPCSTSGAPLSAPRGLAAFVDLKI